MQISLCFQNHMDLVQPATPPGTPLAPCFMIRGMSIFDVPPVATTLAPSAAMPDCITLWVLSASYRIMNDKLLNYPQGMPALDQNPFEVKASRYIARNLTPAE